MGSLLDASPNSRHGSFVGSCVEVSGQVGVASQFSDITRYALVPSSGLNPSPPFWFECWAKLDAVPSTYASPAGRRSDFLYGFDNTRGWNLYAQGPSSAIPAEVNKWAFWTGNGTTVDSNTAWTRAYGGTPTAGAWTYLVGGVTSTDCSLWVDGVHQMTTATTYFSVAADLSLALGAVSHAGASPFLSLGGALDEAALVSGTMTNAKAAARYALRSDPAAYRASVLADSPLGYWQMGCAAEGWLVGAVAIA